MKSLIILACLLAVALAVRDPEWESFKVKFGRKYKSPIEEAFRRKIFLNNKMLVEQQNQRFAEGKSTFKMGINQFADLTTQEFSEQMTRYRMHSPKPEHAEVFVDQGVNAATVDWRDSGCVTGVKDQGQCGSCWAFAVTGCLEYVNCVETGKLVSLSEQNLMDCCYRFGCIGCNGGSIDSGFECAIYWHGIDTEASYPYEAKSTGNCRYTLANRGVIINGYKDVTPYGDESALETASSSIGPIAASIDASHVSFQLYTSGVYDEPLCSSTQLDHGVLVVGYGIDGATPYWLVKNSWGIAWGIQGYIEMSKDKNNQCGIATQASYPIY